MSLLVTAFYHDRDKARLALGDLQATGIPSDQMRLGEGLSEGGGRLDVRARDMDQAIDLRAFLEQDGARSVEITGVEASLTVDTVPPVPTTD